MPTPITGAIRPELSVGPGLAGRDVGCLVVAANAAGTTMAMSAPVKVSVQRSAGIGSS
jgi:hypothetical protein